MNIFRLIMITASALSIGGASYLSYNGVWRDSVDLDRSVRLGSSGNSFSNSSVK